MAVDNTRYNVLFRAPALPYPPVEYAQEDFEQFNNVLRLYFKQLDTAMLILPIKLKQQRGFLDNGKRIHKCEGGSNDH